METKRQLRCSHCGYIWNYKGIMKDYATCPNCTTKTKITEETRAEVETPASPYSQLDIRRYEHDRTDRTGNRIR